MIVLISGGVKSGKSSRALKLAREWQRPVSFIATAEALDDEMRERIERHKTERAGLDFTTIEEPLDLAAAIMRSGEYVLVDCLTMWVNNIMYYRREADFTGMLDAFIEGLRSKSGVIVVSNETGFGNIPADELSRRYNLLIAEANRKTAALADRVELMVAGLPLTVK
ncbi:MAG: bifunctional adenosylcobinamide kinase/adenosylcobinamide-phosphate guanylyltransferase [Spirochaetaceae bacterium]|nr:bifunctional adenosylcobinamide kinase/adenosylcobinamide-phosphate guanylyltransferase [Spirochaetaceae bacterium]